MFNFAFFFAADLRDSDLKSLANVVYETAVARASGTIIISYTNSDKPIASRNYDRFLELTGLEPKKGRDTSSVSYLNRLGQTSPKKQDYSFEIYTAKFL